MRVQLLFLNFFIVLITNAQTNNWPVSIYGGDGAAYGTAPVIKGYLIVNSRNLKGLTHRIYMKDSPLDTLVNSDTIYCRINLYILGSHIDIELSKTNVVSVPISYIESVIGTSYENTIRLFP